VVTPGTPPSGSAVCVAWTGRAVPGPARREAKFVVEEYGGPDGGLLDVRAW
jgi:hypothetical protein